jgi:ABC-type branched-subunit amino acid transport system ATPase component
MAEPLLQVANLHAYYGKSHVLHGVDLTVGKGEIVSLLGRNGVGRSTTVKTVMGLVTGTGSVKFKGDEILGLKAYEIAHRGLGYVPENRDIFPTLTVEQNLMAVARTRRRFQHVQRPTRGVVAEDTAFAALLARPPRWRDVDEFAERSAHEVCMADGGGAA